MPKSKKTSTKKSARRATPVIDDEIHKNIKEAVAPTPLSSAQKIQAQAVAEAKKRRILQAGVAIFASIVFVMWFVNTRSFITDVVHSESTERALLEKAQLDSAAIMATIEAQNTIEALVVPAPVSPPADPERTVRAALADVLGSTPAPTSSASTTEPSISPQ